MKIARGDSFGLAVKVRPGDEVPESARAIYRFADGSETAEPLRSLAGGEFRGRIEAVNQPFKFSVVGGDDATSIRDVAVSVVPPPSLKTLTVRVAPPPYTGIAAQTLAPGLTQLRALEGTRLDLDAEATKPLAAGRAADRRGAFGHGRRLRRFADAVAGVAAGQIELHLLVPHEGQRGVRQSRGEPLRSP